MKKVFVFIIVCLFIVVGNVAAANLGGTWTGTMYCSDRQPGDTGEDFTIVVTQNGDFFTTYNPDHPDETCGGVIDGNKIAMTCRVIPNDSEILDSSITFSHIELKGKVLSIINHKPGDGATCKGTATLFSDEE